MDVLVRLLYMFAHTISTEADVLNVIMNTEMCILNRLSRTKYEEVEIT